MDEFRTIARQWPSGVELDQGEDINQTAIPSTFQRFANSPVLNPDGGTDLQFLFWNTGRRITTKRRVRWNFSVGGWGTWTATRWYGVPSDGSGPPRLHLNAYSIREDRVMTGNPLDSGSSTMGAGAVPLGAPAWPVGGDAQVINTAPGPVHLAALNPFSEAGDPTSHAFSGWLKLQFGGDSTGEFVETDTGFSVSDPNTSSFYAPFGGAIYHAPTNDSGELLAAYGVTTDPERGIPFEPERLRELVELIKVLLGPKDIDPVFDPSPIDRLRLERLAGLLQSVRGGGGAIKPGVQSVEELAAAAKTMNAAQLKRAITEVKATLRRGEVSLKSLETALKQAAKK